MRRCGEDGAGSSGGRGTAYASESARSLPKLEMRLAELACVHGRAQGGGGGGGGAGRGVRTRERARARACEGVCCVRGGACARVREGRVLCARAAAARSRLLEVVVEPAEEDLLGRQLEEGLEGLARLEQPDEVGVGLEVDVGEQRHLDHLPDQPEHEVRPPLLNVRGADVDHRDADRLGRVDRKVEVLCRASARRSVSPPSARLCALGAAAQAPRRRGDSIAVAGGPTTWNLLRGLRLMTRSSIASGSAMLISRQRSTPSATTEKSSVSSRMGSR